jgi:hypothetical protein
VEPDGLAGLRAYMDRLWDAALNAYSSLAETDGAATPHPFDVHQESPS